MAEKKQAPAAEDTLMGDTVDTADDKGYFGSVEENQPDLSVAGVTAKMTPEERARPVAAPLGRPTDEAKTSGPAKTNEPDGTDK